MKDGEQNGNQILTYIKSFDNGFEIIYGSTWIKTCVEMMSEHFSKPKTSVWINTGVEDYNSMHENGRVLNDVSYVYAHLEHKYPIDANGGVSNCSKQWIDVFNKMMCFYSEIWDFQIENFEYFKFHGFEKKYRFRPLRYSKCFENFPKCETPEYDLQFECVVDTVTRKYMLHVLTNEPFRIVENRYIERDLPRLNILFTNTDNFELKYREKARCKYGIDFPHYDNPCTINTFRIYEYLCMNKPCIVWDRDKISARSYFGDLCEWVEDFNTWNIKQIIRKEPRTDIAETYKQMTYSDKDYDEYRLNIIRDYKARSGITVPDYVMD